MIDNLTEEQIDGIIRNAIDVYNSRMVMRNQNKVTEVLIYLTKEIPNGIEDKSYQTGIFKYNISNYQKACSQSTQSPEHILKCQVKPVHVSLWSPLRGSYLTEEVIRKREKVKILTDMMIYGISWNLEIVNQHERERNRMQNSASRDS